MSFIDSILRGTTMPDGIVRTELNLSDAEVCTCVEGYLTRGEHHESNCPVVQRWDERYEDGDEQTGTVEDYEDWQ
jgi:hypothetical protein